MRISSRVRGVDLDHGVQPDGKRRAKVRCTTKIPRYATSRVIDARRAAISGGSQTARRAAAPRSVHLPGQDRDAAALRDGSAGRDDGCASSTLLAAPARSQYYADHRPLGARPSGWIGQIALGLMSHGGGSEEFDQICERSDGSAARLPRRPKLWQISGKTHSRSSPANRKSRTMAMTEHSSINGESRE